MPTILPNLIAIDMQTVLFIKEETAFATEIKVTAADQVLVAGAGTVTQDLAFLPDMQRRNTYSEIGDIVGRYEPGAMTMPVYIKPTGALGTKPECAAFLKNVFGREVVTPASKVEYLLARTTDPLVSHTVWFKQGHLVLRAIGMVVDEAAFPITAGNEDSAVGQMNLTCSFANMLWTGTDELAAATSAASGTVTVKDAKKFTPGGYIEIGSLTNTGLGFKVDAVDYVLNTLTVTPVVGGIAPIDAIVKPWVPTGSEIGQPIHGRFGIATRDGVPLRVINATITLRNNFKWLNNEKNGLSYPDRVLRATKREVDVEFELLMDANAPSFFRDAQQGLKADIVMPVGDAPGRRYTLTAKNVRLSTPTIQGAEEKTSPMTGKAFATVTYDDELALLLD